MKRLLALLLAVVCVLSMTACGKDPEPTEPYVPPVQGGQLHETEPVVEPTITEPVIEETEPEETTPVETESIEETEPIVEETEPVPTKAEEMKALFEGNEMYFWYNQLTDTQKDFYIATCLTIESGYNTVLLGDIQVSNEDIEKVLLCVSVDHPEYFWFDVRSHSVNTINNENFSVEVSYFPELIDKLEANKIAFNRIVDALVAKAQEKNSILDQERMIHDYICKSTIYETGPLDQSAWSCLVERKTVCAGYSKAFQIIMNRLGIPCYYVIGDFITPEETARHAWNVIKLVDGYYAVDLTHNDSNEKGAVLYYKYNFAYSTFEGVYVPDELFKALPDCVDTRYSFKNTYGVDENVASAMALLNTDIVISSMDEFKYLHEQMCRQNGFGEWDFQYVVVGKDLFNQIYTYCEERSYYDTYIADIAIFNNYHTISLQNTYSQVEFDDVLGISQTIIFTGS